VIDSNIDGDTLMVAGVVIGSMLTFAYAFRFWHGAFGRKAATESSVVAAAGNGAAKSDGAVAAPHAPSAAFLAPAAVLGVLSVLLGLLPMVLDDTIGAAAASLDPEIHGV